jgi:Tol biopolymer transport system component
MIQRARTVAVIMATVLFAAAAFAAEKLPAAKAGTISQPTGRIAFIRDKNIWAMEASGANKMMICEATNAEGRLSWSADNRRIIFTRAGAVELKAPDGTGGKHKVYDLFLAYLDSAEAGKTFFWYRLTNDLGSREPEWSADGSQIIFTKDLNANLANAVLPNYQVCTMDPEGGHFDILRKDWQNMGEFFTSPTMNAKGDIAFVHFYEQRPRGMAMLNKAKFMASLDTVRTMSTKMAQMLCPSWSPDGKWLSYVSNDTKENGLYICSADLREKYIVFTPTVNTYVMTHAAGWSPDSKWLTFATTDGSVWISDITGNQAKRISGPGTDSAPAWTKAPRKAATTAK